ncbi:MAG: recombinase family protein [Eubacteriales bacterium]|nr:recombinase family protein [Eubacteriales bacterium]
MQSKNKKAKTEEMGITALYNRLSRDDVTDSESNSIANQKKLLSQKAKEFGLTNTRYYVDDGYTGTNFNRPAFQQMIEDIEMGYVTTVMFKDLSRLGRDYVSVGSYTDSYFPNHNVRFIAVNDGIDSDEGESEIAPFKNILNEMYARDISKKIRSSHRLRGNAGEPLSPPPFGYTKSPENNKKWIIDPEAAAIVKRIYKMCLEGNGYETIARILQEEKILNPQAYWQSKGIGRGGKKTQPNPYKWCKTTVEKILAQQEYCGDIINFKTYSKSFKNKTRLDNPPENWVIFKDVHEPIIERATFEQVQRITANTKRRAPKPENAQKSIFSDLLYCGDCHSKLRHHTNTINKDIHFFVCANNSVDYRGTCKSRHYVRADSIEQVVMLELRRMADFLRKDEGAFADLLAQKTNKELLKEQKQAEADLQKAIVRNDTVSKLYEKLYEDNASGKVSDEWFMQLSHKYETERLELKAKITELRRKLSDMGSRQQERDNFIHAIRRFMEMGRLTAPLLRELIDHIDVFETEGVGKSRTQRIVIYYRFVGYIELPDSYFRSNYKADTRKGVAVEYIPTIPA